ncbi:MAG: ATP-binding protein [Desulfosporosinus sp.]|nr:ATP-binding protein [Desulfosporosinus sp.]
MIFRSFAGKIWVIIVSWVFLVLLIFGGILAKSTHDFYYGYASEENEELTDTALNISSYLSSLPNFQAAAEPFNLLGSIFKYDLIVTDLDGNVILGTHRLQDWHGVVMPSQDMAQLKQGRNVSFEGNTPYASQRILKVATPVIREKKITGAVFVLEPLTYLETVGQSVNSSIGWGLAFSFLLSIPLGLILARQVAHPVVEMDRAIKDIATGNYTRILPRSSTDELASLGQSVNTLSEEIQHKLLEITRERQQLSNILASIDDGVISISPSKEIVMANRVAVQLFGGPRAKTRITLQDLPEDLRSLLQNSITQPIPHYGEFKIDDRVFRVETSPLLTEQEGQGLVAVWHDVTKDRQIEGLRREFITNVSHELRTPLSYLQGYSEALLDDIIPSKEQQRRYLETILRETLRLRRLVNHLLDLDRIEYGGALELPHEAVFVPDLITSIKEQVTPAAMQKQVTFCVEMDPNLAPVDCGTDRLKQILLNLTDNALRFSPQGGVIWIAAKDHHPWIEITVHDQGPGIPMEDQMVIWNRFERGQHRPKSDSSGSGLGLAIVNSLVQAYKGEVSLVSDVGKGAQFTVRLVKYKIEAHS